MPPAVLCCTHGLFKELDKQAKKKVGPRNVQIVEFLDYLRQALALDAFEAFYHGSSSGKFVFYLGESMAC